MPTKGRESLNYAYHMSTCWCDINDLEFMMGIASHRTRVMMTQYSMWIALWVPVNTNSTQHL